MLERGELIKMSFGSRLWPWNQKGSNVTAPVERIQLRIGLPISSDHPKPRVFNVEIPSNMTSEELKSHLAEKFNVNKDKWQLVATGDNKKQHVLGKNASLREYSSNNRVRLYFYPGINK